ncbi:hypothetical protein LWI29_029294 [Acer saccharum]|uniref:ABC-2 type transporter transmembrane domain-containing protein n=1 Tax=Acer saccharum TaxID=4024 RepID=A0AA39S6L9_ACESA|nr:hypothetical protein LWI29_029294 [Acer saccharum]
MYADVLFLGASNATSMQPVVSVERTVFYRERAAGMYSALPYAFVQVAMEVIYVKDQTFMYSLILYSMIGFKWQVGKCLWFSFFILMCFTYFTMYKISLVALTLAVQIAAILMSFFLSFWNLFAEIDEKDEEALWWTAIKWLLTYDRLKKGVLRQVLDNRKVVQGEVDVTNLSMQDKKQLKESLKKIMRSFLGDLDTESTDDCYSQLKPKNKATYRSWSEKTLMTKKAFLKQSINLGMLICEAFAQIEWA